MGTATENEVIFSLREGKTTSKPQAAAVNTKSIVKDLLQCIFYSYFESDESALQTLEGTE